MSLINLTNKKANDNKPVKDDFWYHINLGQLMVSFMRQD